jgi:hypothetical protein
MSVPSLVRSRRGTKILVGAALVIAFSASAAHAASVSTTGSKASNSGNTLTVTDTRADGDDAYANWNRSGHNRVQTSGGINSTAQVTPGSLTSFRACRDQGSLNPDNCSSWVGP